jgi:hypothetical protein
MMERVGDRQEKKWKDLVRQAKAHRGLQCQRKKKKVVLLWAGNDQEPVIREVTC